MAPKCFKCGIDASVGDVAIWNIDHFLWVRDSQEWQNCTGKWTLPNAIWSRADFEACNVYCKSCWMNWAQFVKPGRKWALSRSCEEMAIRVGIQFDHYGGHQYGNPFYCPHCHSYFNHGAASLEKHLLQSQCQSHRHTVAVKRKQRDEFEEPILFVSGCSNFAVSSTIKGKYAAKRWHHGKPVYEKEYVYKSPSNRPVLISFWKDPLEPEMCGWRFSPREGDSHMWAHHSNCDPECLTVPKAGWKAPWDGEVDTALKITTEEIQETNQANQAQTNQANQLCSELGNSNFELRWEFLVTNEPDEEWQLMSEEMNDALEKRWAQGWHGDNGKLGGIISYFFCERDFTCMSEEDMKRCNSWQTYFISWAEATHLGKMSSMSNSMATSTALIAIALCNGMWRQDADGVFGGEDLDPP